MVVMGGGLQDALLCKAQGKGVHVACLRMQHTVLRVCVWVGVSICMRVAWGLLGCCVRFSVLLYEPCKFVFQQLMSGLCVLQVPLSTTGKPVITTWLHTQTNINKQTHDSNPTHAQAAPACPAGRAAAPPTATASPPPAARCDGSSSAVRGWHTRPRRRTTATEPVVPARAHTHTHTHTHAHARTLLLRYSCMHTCHFPAIAALSPAAYAVCSFVCYHLDVTNYANLATTCLTRSTSITGCSRPLVCGGQVRRQLCGSPQWLVGHLRARLWRQ